ncbi:NAD(P)H:quinone oxidoreductase [Lysobacter korlensis]|uniref:NAD(P)H:quinone oxidoreductase n=1 Tax=Lysobacter korlensis TaxID=553636 RepID=A0ABV6S1D1_9GAMM
MSESITDIKGSGPKVTIIYYSSTGGTYALAQSIAAGAASVGAEVRVRKVKELAPPAVVARDPEWEAHARETEQVPVATHDDLVWADAVLLGTPTRYGLPSSQLKQFIDTTGGLWEKGLLANKVYASFTSTGTAHGGLESTLIALNNAFYHWGGFIVPPGYTSDVQFEHGNPYGASHMAANGGPNEVTLASAHYLGERVATVAAVTRPLRESQDEMALA